MDGGTLHVHVRSYMTMQGSGFLKKAYENYCIHCSWKPNAMGYATLNPHEWDVYHRYSEFEAMRDELKLLVASLPKLPSKIPLKKGLDKINFIEKRRKGLSAFLKCLLADHGEQLIRHPSLNSFLSVAAGIGAGKTILLKALKEFRVRERAESAAKQHAKRRDRETGANSDDDDVTEESAEKLAFTPAASLFSDVEADDDEVPKKCNSSKISSLLNDDEDEAFQKLKKRKGDIFGGQGPARHTMRMTPCHLCFSKQRG